MNVIKSITGGIWNSLQDSFNMLWGKVWHVLPTLIVVLVVLAIGLWLAAFISEKVNEVVKSSKVDVILDKVVAPLAKLTGVKVSTSTVIEVAVKWFLIALVLVTAFDIANLNGVINFFLQALGYIPKLFLAALIIIVGGLMANLASAIIKLVSKSDGIATTAKGAVNALAFITALAQIAIPLVAALSQFVGKLNLSQLRADVLFIGLIVLILLASRTAVTKTVENLIKS